MKIIFSARENRGGDSPLDDRFGRAAGFALFDDEKGEWSWIDNTSNADAAGGAGVQAGQAVANSGAGVYIGAQLGPKAQAVLSKTSIQLFAGEANKSAAENYSLYKAGKLQKL